MHLNGKTFHVSLFCSVMKIEGRRFPVSHVFVLIHSSGNKIRSNEPWLKLFWVTAQSLKAWFINMFVECETESFSKPKCWAKMQPLIFTYIWFHSPHNFYVEKERSAVLRQKYRSSHLDTYLYDYIFCTLFFDNALSESLPVRILRRLLQINVEYWAMLAN